VSARRTVTIRRGIAALPLILLSLLLLAACAPAPQTEKAAYKRQLFTLGTVVEVSLWDVDETLAAEAVRRVETVLNDAHTRWHAWEPSELTRLNTALAAGESMEVTAETAALLRRARALAAQSGQTFNPAIGRLIALWGFQSDNPPLGPPPAQAEIDALLAAAPDMDVVGIEGTRIDSANPAVQIDLGGFAKGYAIDRAVEALRELGIDNAIVNAGGDLRAIGRHGERPWRIGIRQPVNDGGVFASLETHGDESVFTSGGYERFFDYEGRRYHHILDPGDGYPVRHTLSVTVIHDEATAADAAITALFIAGPEGWPAMARRMGIAQVMLIDADMKVHMTPRMAERVYFEVQPPPTVIVTELAP
jgi:thiamine biosynthesis lipoprotein